MNDIDKGQINHNAADTYEEFFVPAVFGEWPAQLIAAAQIQAGQKVLDVACGTGVLARDVLDRVGSAGGVAGVDINEGMLAVAKRIAPDIDWRQEAAEALPFENGHFDAVVSQFGLMFFADKVAALKEMLRVLRPGGHLAVAVWDTLENTPGYAQITSLLQRLFGEETANGLRAPYSLGDKAVLNRLLAAAGLTDAIVATHVGRARFPSIRAWMFTEIKGWTLADMIDDDQFHTLLEAAETEMRPFLTPENGVEFATPAHIVAFSKN